MNHRRFMLGAAFGLGLASVAFAAGGTVRQATNGSLDYIYNTGAPGQANDRAITRYGVEGVAAPNGSEFDPNTILCGARSRSGHQSSITVNRPELLDIRLEDPNNPGFPNVLAVPAAGSVYPVAADSNAAPIQCPQSVAYQNYTFNAGAGIVDPQQAVFLTWQFGGITTTDSCYLGLELFSSPGNGRSKYYVGAGAGGTYGQLTFGGTAGNHWLDLVAFTPLILDLNFRMHGSAQFAGDRGQPIWFIRPVETAGTTVDDYISTTIVVDNGTGAPIGQEILSLVGDRSVINPKLTPKDLSASFRLLGSKASLASGNPYSWAPGRTRLEANIPATINAKFQSLFPINLPFIARTQKQTPPGPFDDENQNLGLRRQRGQIDDGSAEIAFIVQSPVVTGDALAQRFPLTRLFPRTGVNASNPVGTGTQVTSITITNITVGAVSNGGAGGYDAVQVRRDDPVILNSADGSPQGRLGGTGGVGDASVDVAIPIDPNGLCALFPIPQVPSIVVSNLDDIWVNVYPFPNDTVTGATFLCEDTAPGDTVIGQSFTSPAGAQPYTLDPTGNWISRLIFTSSAPLAGDGNFSTPSLSQKGALPLRTAGQVPTLTKSSR